MNIGQRIRGRRVLSGLSQGALAERLGVMQSYVSLIENDEDRSEGMSIRQLRRFAEGVTVKLTVLVDQDEYEAALPVPAPAEATQ
jgi:transcriptional regulator with XRE-family HTH domain